MKIGPRSGKPVYEPHGYGLYVYNVNKDNPNHVLYYHGLFDHGQLTHGQRVKDGAKGHEIQEGFFQNHKDIICGISSNGPTVYNCSTHQLSTTLLTDWQEHF